MMGVMDIYDIESIRNNERIGRDIARIEVGIQLFVHPYSVFN